MPISFDYWLRALQRHAKTSLKIFLAIVAMTMCVILFAPRRYTSEASLMLRIGRESVTLDPTATTVGETLNLHHTRENQIQSALGVMKSREILERVVDEVGEEVVLSGHPALGEGASRRLLSYVSSLLSSPKSLLGMIDPVPNRQQAVRKLSRGVYLSSQKESSVVSIAYTTKSPEVAQDVVSKWVDHYIVQHAQVNHTDGSLKFFEDQCDLLRNRLDRAREELQTAKNRSHLVTVDGQQKLLESQLAKVRNRLVDVDSEMESVRSRVAAYDGILQENSSMITTAVTGKVNEARDLMRSRLFELEVLQKDLESKFKPGHPKLVSIQNQIKDAEEIVSTQKSSREEVTQAISPAYQQLRENKLVDQAALAGMLQKKQSLTQTLASVHEEIADLNSTERGIASIESEVMILEGRYADSAVKKEQARMDDVLAKERITSVNIVQPATLEMRPVSPNKPFCLVAGLFSALALSLGMPILLEMRHGRGPKPAPREAIDDWGFEQRERDHSQGSLSDRSGDSEREETQTESPQPIGS